MASSLYAPGTNLSRSVSSFGEHQSDAYISPTLPKRAETFGGFDNANKDQLPAATVKGVCLFLSVCLFICVCVCGACVLVLYSSSSLPRHILATQMLLKFHSHKFLSIFLICYHCIVTAIY